MAKKMPPAKLKPLEWHEKNGRQWLAVSPANRVYSIRKNDAWFDGIYYLVYVNSQLRNDLDFGNLESAQEYCQNDFKEHIESCYE